MIFDSPRMQSLLIEYNSVPDFLLPSVVFLARSKKLENERLLIESLIRQVAPVKQKEWLSRLLKVDDAQYLGAWFEIMLFGWMKNVGVVEVEPIIKGNYPDLSVVIGEQKAFVEARVILKTNSERNEEKLTDWIFWALNKIQKTYGVSVLVARASKLPQLADFCSKVENWLDTDLKRNSSTRMVLLLL